MKKTKHWLQRHTQDPYVQAAQKKGYRSRASFKLVQIQQNYQLIQPGMLLADLGAAPGGWSQVMIQFLGKKGHVFAIDRLAMTAMPNVTLIQGDFNESAIIDELLNKLGAKKLDGIFSDLCPDLTGIKSMDDLRFYNLSELAFDFCQHTLCTKGYFVIKLFHGSGFDIFLKTLRIAFKKVSIEKPDASRNRSKEVYCVAQGFKAM